MWLCSSITDVGGPLCARLQEVVDTLLFPPPSSCLPLFACLLPSSSCPPPGPCFLLAPLGSPSVSHLPPFFRVALFAFPLLDARVPASLACGASLHSLTCFTSNSATVPSVFFVCPCLHRDMTPIVKTTSSECSRGHHHTTAGATYA